MSKRCLTPFRYVALGMCEFFVVIVICLHVMLYLLQQIDCHDLVDISRGVAFGCQMKGIHYFGESVFG